MPRTATLPKAMEPGHSPFAPCEAKALSARKFRDPHFTADGQQRASVPFVSLETLWVNTGTLCNLSCANCYIESSPSNDRLAYFRADDLANYLDEASNLSTGLQTVGFTGGEPFMNPDIMALMGMALIRDYEVLVLTNAMRPMRRHEAALRALQARYSGTLSLRVSLDHYAPAIHDSERGQGSWHRAVDGLQWLLGSGFQVTVAGRMPPGQPEDHIRSGFSDLFRNLDADLDAMDHRQLILFAEMDAGADVPEISEACWNVLGRTPEEVMCATSRMVVRRKGAQTPSVIACTLLPDTPEFDLGPRLAGARGDVRLNHPHCARFCVLGGSSCSGSAS